MYKSKHKGNFVFKLVKFFFNRLKRILYLIMIASMMGFSNAFYDETKMINDLKFGTEQEQVIDDKEPKDW